MEPATRRRFLVHLAAGLAASPVRARAPSERITLGCIGVGTHGLGYNLKSFLQQDDCRIVAVCDVFRSRAQQAKQVVDAHHGDAACHAFQDFRELLAREDIDAVVISTPDHWHVPMSLMALAAGKHVFCEKPSLTVAEGRELVARVREAGKVFQTGLEDRSKMHYHKLAEAVRNGAIGALERIELGLPGKTRIFEGTPAPVPDDLDYNLWLGPAPEAPFSPDRVSAQGWRQISHYSGGVLTDWGSHLLDTAQVALGEHRRGPLTVEGWGEIPEGGLNDVPNRFDLTYTYPGGIPVRVRSGEVSFKAIGSEGWVGNRGWDGPLEAHDRTLFRRTYPENRLWPRPPGEHRDFLDAIRTGRETTYPAEDFHRLSTALHLGNIAMRLGRKLAWDPDREHFPHDPEAEPLLRRPSRTGW